MYHVHHVLTLDLDRFNFISGTAGGAPTRLHKRACLNPQYLLYPLEPHTSVFITLEQPSLYLAKHVCIFVSSVGGRRFDRIRGRTLVCDSTPFSNSTLVSCEIPDLTEAIERTRPTEADDTGGDTSGGGGGGGGGSWSSSFSSVHRVDESYFVDGALTIMVCTFEENVPCDYRLTVYSNYPLKCADATNCGAGVPGECLPRMGALTPMEPHPRGKKKRKSRTKRRKSRTKQ